MTQNDHLAPVLQSYVSKAEPGFALLVTAPWGAGKTYSVKSWLRDKPHVYVSLFGAKSPEAIADRLFDALVETADVKAPSGAAKALDDAAKKFTGVQIDLTGFHRRLVLKQLPKLLVFDDLERSAMSGPDLLSAINVHVEHEGRNVILLANEDELDRTPDYRRWREKVIGRSIAITAPAEAALRAFLAALPQGPARQFLDAERAILLDVFVAGGTQNLRLLRQAVLEFVDFHTQLPPDILRNTVGMRSLLADFTALTIAFHEGKDFGRSDLRQESDWNRGIWEANGRSGDEPEPSPINLLRKKLGSVASIALDGTAISGALAEMVIADGHAPTAMVEAQMRATSLFRGDDPESWMNLWAWRWRPESQVADALDRVKESLARQEYQQPETILHVFAIQLDLAVEHIIDPDLAKVVQQAKAYISAVEQAGGFNMLFTTGRRPRLDRVSSHGRGYMQRDLPEFEAIFQSLTAALERSDESANSTRLSDLLASLQDRPDYAQIALLGGLLEKDIPDYSRPLIFAGSDPQDVAQRVFEAPAASWRGFLAPFKDRIARQEARSRQDGGQGRTEREWMLRFRDASLAIAEASSKIRQAQIKVAIGYHLKFLSPNSKP